MANFFWGDEDGSSKWHWKQWHALCRPTCENGLGLRKLEDILSAFTLKLWWNFFTSKSLGAIFMRQKYCVHGEVQNSSQTWKCMQRVRHLVLNNIQKLIKNWESSF
ncbi:hypothetical protein ACH5RR_025834 [Cinchona calisaya]|uniref:Uncharacterized protein n=1 Tax=Cinchona calisaya TaxID=153742 RepID=A0ABD2Z0T0_9GENT